MGFSVSLSTVGKSNLSITSGDWAKQANGSVKISLGDTVVLATVCMSSKESKLDYFPLTVEYQERTYAMGKIPGGFLKKEGKSKDSEILTSRLIDRPLRPLFPSGFMKEVQIITMALSSDSVNDPDVVAINGASAALVLSDIPFGGPIGAVRVGCIDGKFILNPSYEERAKSSMDLVVVGTVDKVTMLEGDFEQIDEATVAEAIEFAHPGIRQIIDLQNELAEKCGKDKIEFVPPAANTALIEIVKAKALPKLDENYGKAFTKKHAEAIDKSILAYLETEINTEANAGLFLTEDHSAEISAAYYLLHEEHSRKKIVTTKVRPDGRSIKQIRSIECLAGVLPCTHGSAMFTRGQTQALVVTTLGTSSDAQTVEELEGTQLKHFMLQYNFPPFSVGETKALRGPSRRDIGHGTLAEKSFFSVIPSKEEFPYTFRVVSEILESNGSSSMATVCGTSMSLMDAGVPLKEAVAGIAMGLIKEGDDYQILTDIAGIEDHTGDMDFKVSGTKNGVAAIQLDIKIDGVSFDIIRETLERAREGRMEILGKMNATISEGRKTLSAYAPKIKTFKIDPDKIGTLIGPGGKNIRKLSAENNITIDIDDETQTVFITAQSQKDLERGYKQVMGLVRDVEVGDIYDEAVVARIVNFGAFCDFAPGKSGLVHVSEISNDFIKDVTSVLKEGDIVKVKVISIDNQGRINLSIKQAQ